MKAAFKVCLLFVLLALVGPGNALALTSQQAVEKIRAAFDEKTIRQGLDEVRYFKKAGFICRPCPCRVRAPVPLRKYGIRKPL